MKARPHIPAPKRDPVTRAKVDKILRLRGKFRAQVAFTNQEKKLYNQLRYVKVIRGGLVDTSSPPELMQTIETYNTRTSPFIKLPGEIRNHIYDIAFDKIVTIYSMSEDEETAEADDPLPFRIRTNVPPLWLVCRQVYRETFLMLCTMPTFRIDSALGLHEFTRQIDKPQLKSIRTLEFTEDTLWATKNDVLKKFTGLEKLIVPFTAYTTEKLVTERLNKVFPGKKVTIVNNGPETAESKKTEMTEETAEENDDIMENDDE